MNKVLPLISLFIMSIISIFYWLFKPNGVLYEAKWNAPDTTIAITLDGEISTSFPTTKYYETSVECTSGSGELRWNGTKWSLITSNITKGSTKCNAIFDSVEPSLAYDVLNDNDITSPITTPGKVVSAYTNDDISATKSWNVSSGSYITYGTGWEANGTGFDLTGAAVSGDYSDYYSSLVGKYIPNKGLHYGDDFISSVPGGMRTTTGLSSLYYVVSATRGYFNYIEISSNKNTTEAVLAPTEDDYGTSYYFRGAVKNNYVQFANKCWRIVRVTGNKSVKLVLHNDNVYNSQNPCSSNNNDSTAAFAHPSRNSSTLYAISFNSNNGSNTNDNTFVGFMYGGKGASSYLGTHSNSNKSVVLNNLETWYKNNLSSYTDKLADVIWCNDKSVVTDTSYNPFGHYPGSNFGYGKNINYYNSMKRLYASDGSSGGTGPTLICPNDNSGGKLSKFTVSDKTNGNGNLTYKIGLLTADELVFAGYADKPNPSVYLQENATGPEDDTSTFWWTMTPSHVDDSAAYVGIIDEYYGKFA